MSRNKKVQSLFYRKNNARGIPFHQNENTIDPRRVLYNVYSPKVH